MKEMPASDIENRIFNDSFHFKNNNPPVSGKLLAKKTTALNNSEDEYDEYGYDEEDEDEDLKFAFKGTNETPKTKKVDIEFQEGNFKEKEEGLKTDRDLY